MFCMWLSRWTGCRVPRVFFVTHDSLQLGRSNEGLHSELEAVVGSVGVTDGVASLLQTSWKCFDWQDLATRVPSSDDARAFPHRSLSRRPTLDLGWLS